MGAWGAGQVSKGRTGGRGQVSRAGTGRGSACLGQWVRGNLNHPRRADSQDILNPSLFSPQTFRKFFLQSNWILSCYNPDPATFLALFHSFLLPSPNARKKRLQGPALQGEAQVISD